jgi:hypothetical protein
VSGGKAFFQAQNVSSYIVFNNAEDITDQAL